MLNHGFFVPEFCSLIVHLSISLWYSFDLWLLILGDMVW